MKKIYFLFTLTISTLIFGSSRFDSEPYISGDTFRKYANHIFDETDTSLNPESVKKGDTVFVAMGEIAIVDKFFNEVHPKITQQYILITHNGDTNMPGKYKDFLDDPKIFAWFTQNIDMSHHKLISIPIGLENGHWARHYVPIINELIQLNINKSKEYVLSGSFRLHTNPARRFVYDLFTHKNFCYLSPEKSVYECLVDVAHSKFILSPRGNGLDCHRTWEALCLGTFPVVKTSTLDGLYKDLPVLIVDDWNDVTDELIEKKYIEFITDKKYKTEKLYFKYWLDLILDCQNKCRNSCSFESLHYMPAIITDQLNLFKANFLKNHVKTRLGQELIPKKIHQIWIGPKPLPEKFLWMIETIKKNHPEWEYKLWTNQDLENFNLKNKNAFDRVTNIGAKADIFRYEILCRHGGVYLDIDFESLKPLDELNNYGYDFYGCLIGGTDIIANGIIACCPNHPIIAECIEKIGNIKEFDNHGDNTFILNLTGPYFFTAVVTRFLLNNLENYKIGVLPSNYFFPFPSILRGDFWENKLKRETIMKYIKSESFAIHYWATSWQ